MHKIHECCYELEMPISCFKYRLRDICLLKSQLIVAGAEIYLGLDLGPTQLIKQIIDPRQRAPILDSNPIQLPIIYTQPKSLVPLLGKRTAMPKVKCSV